MPWKEIPPWTETLPSDASCRDTELAVENDEASKLATKTSIQPAVLADISEAILVEIEEENAEES